MSDCSVYLYSNGRTWSLLRARSRLWKVGTFVLEGNDTPDRSVVYRGPQLYQDGPGGGVQETPPSNWSEELKIRGSEGKNREG